MHHRPSHELTKGFVQEKCHYTANTPRFDQNGCYLADNIFKGILKIENISTLIEILLKYVLEVP